MSETDRPPGWRYNPSAWRHRLPILVLAVIGFAIATYLTLYQLGVLAEVWEPFFGNGSNRILRQSAVAHLLPVPDAALGAFVYLLDAIADVAGGRVRWRTAPGFVLVFGLIALSLGVVGVLLAILQPTLFGAFCTLCLASAACSVLTAVLAAPEVLAAVQGIRRQKTSGKSLWQALRGRGAGEK